MARTMQQKITDHLELLAESHKGVELVAKASYANTGTLYAQRGFDTLVKVTYSFQDEYASFGLSGRLVDRIDVRAQPWARWIGPEPGKAKVGRTGDLPGDRSLNFHRSVYGNGHDMAVVFGLFDALLDSDRELV